MDHHETWRNEEHDLHKAKTIKFNYATDLAVHDNLITLINFQLQNVILWGARDKLLEPLPGWIYLMKSNYNFVSITNFLLMSGSSSHVKNF